MVSSLEALHCVSSVITGSTLKGFWIESGGGRKGDADWSETGREGSPGQSEAQACAKTCQNQIKSFKKTDDQSFYVSTPLFFHPEDKLPKYWYFVL